MIKISFKNVTFKYTNKVILDDASVEFEEGMVHAIVGQSGIGKSTLLSIINRLYETLPEASCKGDVDIRINGHFYSTRQIPAATIRKKVSMVFQVPNPLPMSIYDNLAFALKLHDITDKVIIKERVTNALKDTLLWDEVKDRLKESALRLSIGQQQRLCIARALIVNPEVILLDEPTSSLDEANARHIEELIIKYKSHCTIIIVSHQLEQVKRITDRVYTIVGGKIVEMI